MRCSSKNSIEKAPDLSAVFYVGLQKQFQDCDRTPSATWCARNNFKNQVVCVNLKMATTFQRQTLDEKGNTACDLLDNSSGIKQTCLHEEQL